jgi:hypothetical protein
MGLGHRVYTVDDHRGVIAAYAIWIRAACNFRLVCAASPRRRRRSTRRAFREISREARRSEANY